MAKDNWVSRVASSARNLFTQPHYLPGQIGNKPIVNLSKPTQQLANLMQVSTAESDRPLHPTWDTRSALRDGFNASHYVYSCIMLLSKEAARPIWMLEQRATGTGKERFWEPIPDSDFEALMLHPNAHQSGLDLMERGLQHFFLTGNMLFLKVRSAMRSRVPKELYNIQPDQIRPVPSRNNFLSHYEFTSPGMEPIAIDPDDIIHIQIANPATPFWGMSPLQAMSRIVDTEVDALNWWRWAIRNRAAKDGFIKYKRMLTDDEYAKIKRQLIEQVVGPWNARLPMILTGDADWVATSSDAVDMDFIDLRKMTREEICFVPGTQIVTSEGLRPIEEVEVGDLVLTHTGQYRCVLETMFNSYDGGVITVKAEGLAATTCTPKHPWYVTRVRDGIPECDWIAAEDIELSDYLTLPFGSQTVTHKVQQWGWHQYSGFVYNLRVDIDNSYVTTGGTVHNCGGFGIPPMLVGIMDQATYNNLREARMGLWQDTIVTYLDKFRSAFDHQLLPDFISGPALRKHRTAPDLSRIPALLNHLSSMAEPAGKFWQMGVPFNELNARFGLGFRPLPPEVGDISWVGSLTQPAEEALNDGAEGQPAFSTDWSDIQSIAEGKPPKSPPQRGKPMAGSPNPSANVPQGEPTPRRVKPQP